MSLERDVTEIIRLCEGEAIAVSPLNEGFGRAKELYVDQGVKGPDGKLVKIPLQVLKRLASKDPTYPEKGKYVEWMARMYLQQRSARGFDTIAKFHEMAERNQIAQKDINQYKTLEEVDDAIIAAHAKEETKHKSKQQLFQETVAVDTEVLGMIDRTPNFVNPHSGESTVDGYRVDGVPEDKPTDATKKTKEHPGKQKIKYLEGPKAGKEEIVKNERIQGNPGDMFYENDKIVIVCPHDNATSELYGRNPDCAQRDKVHSYWCTSSPGSRYFQSYWSSGGKTLYYILPKTPAAVLYDTEPGHFDRFSKVAVVVTSDGRLEGVFDRFDIDVPTAKWKELCKLWGISPQVAKAG